MDIANINKLKTLNGDMVKRFHVVIKQDEDGGYTGWVPEIQGCVSQGDSLDNLMDNVREAIELCLEVSTTQSI